ncbi:hypothetical protein ACC717_03860 [Rhizobium ruizarguesonis]|uniref:Uncharacterized protein n=1 Tax=Rhizobium ruizarguesonis TaxID=2081791 RepID=A0AB38I6M0_9HYPH|nr:hypothetical protein [Rhizobium ruizarguesonis]TBB66214.1 hypothetical protein ELH42_08600 [Rhizobium ruizarguesonis]TBB70606.1 hypothetical protein ELH45_08650 [Rhizobium ruizarguesonis]TBC15636.1 hypothetical protein ELH40_12215 [Rhizobium ruizarguesonis]
MANMLVGAVTLVFIDVLFDASVERQRRPGTRTAVRAASEIHGDAIRLVFDLYGASVLAVRLTLRSIKDSRRIALLNEWLKSWRGLLFATLRSFHPTSLRKSTLFEDVVTIQRKVEVTLAAHGQYLSPSLAAALFELSRAELVSFMATCVPLGAVPEFFGKELFAQYFASLKSLTDALVAADPSLNTRLSPAGAMQMLSQPGLLGKNAEPAALV